MTTTRQSTVEGSTARRTLRGAAPLALLVAALLGVLGLHRWNLPGASTVAVLAGLTLVGLVGYWTGRGHPVENV